MSQKLKAKQLQNEIQALFKKYGMYIDVHSDFNAWLRDAETHGYICEVFGDCDIDYETIGD